MQGGLNSTATAFNLITLSGTVSYALDIFGGERRAVEGLRAQAEYQRYLSYAAYLSLSANVVNTSIARAAYVAEVRATEQLIELQEQQLHSTQVQVQTGTAAYSDVLSLQSLIASNRAQLAPLKQKISQTEDLLATLEGAVPSKALLPDINLSALTLPVELPLSLPSDLVLQRPDILASEMQLHAASANIGVATAALFPSISLSGSYGASGVASRRAVRSQCQFWSVGPSATIPLFEGGRLWFGRKAAIDAYEAAQANYRQTVLEAFAQVGDALNALAARCAGAGGPGRRAQAAGEALHLVQVNYQAGLVAYLNVWAADVQFHQTNIDYLQALAQRYQDTVALYVALGGGWWNGPSVAESREP